MPYHRVIFRLDFMPNFDIIETPAKTMRIIMEKYDSFLPDLGEDIVQRSITAKYEAASGDYIRSITVTPTAITGLIDTSKGIKRSGVLTDTDLAKLIKIANELRSSYHINNLVRTGLRFYYFSKIAAQEGSVNNAFQRLFDHKFIKSLHATLGTVNDLAFVLDGEHEDKILYHLRSGPYFKGELSRKKYLTINPDKFDENNDVDLILDVDMYENNHTLNETVSFAKWCDPLVKRANKLIEELKPMLAKLVGDN